MFAVSRSTVYTFSEYMNKLGAAGVCEWTNILRRGVRKLSLVDGGTADEIYLRVHYTSELGSLFFF